jgi:hypothetical protein
MLKITHPPDIFHPHKGCLLSAYRNLGKKTKQFKDLFPCFTTSITFRKGSAALFASAFAVALAAAFALALPSGRFLAAALANQLSM